MLKVTLPKSRIMTVTLLWVLWVIILDNYQKDKCTDHFFSVAGNVTTDEVYGLPSINSEMLQETPGMMAPYWSPC